MSEKEIMMKVLLTGASGNVGAHVLNELLRQGHMVRCFVPEQERRAGRRLMRQGKAGQVEVVVGDIRNSDDVAAAVVDQEVVIHLAAIIPPLSDYKPSFARAINVGGTRNLLAAMQAQARPPRLIYASSVALFGNTQMMPPPRRVGDPLAPMDPYSRHKAECERLIAESGLTWAILRLAAVPRFHESFDPIRLRAMFAIPLTDRIETIHPYDAALALVNAVVSPDVWGKTLIIAGGPRCRMLVRDYYRGYFDAAGVGLLPAENFATTSYHLDWYDTDESQALLHYQRHSYEDFILQCRRNLKLVRWAMKLVRPVVRLAMLRYADTGKFQPQPVVQPAKSGQLRTGALASF
jgi:UDP-glucose 4-epimerase